MRPKPLVAAAALALLAAACDAATATGPSFPRTPAGPAAEGIGMFGSGSVTPPPDTTHP